LLRSLAEPESDLTFVIPLDCQNFPTVPLPSLSPAYPAARLDSPTSRDRLHSNGENVALPFFVVPRPFLVSTPDQLITTDHLPVCSPALSIQPCVGRHSPTFVSSGAGLPLSLTAHHHRYSRIGTGFLYLCPCRAQFVLFINDDPVSAELSILTGRVAADHSNHQTSDLRPSLARPVAASVVDNRTPEEVIRVVYWGYGE
jgi:hypothetical protein